LAHDNYNTHHLCVDNNNMALNNNQNLLRSVPLAKDHTLVWMDAMGEHAMARGHTISGFHTTSRRNAMAWRHTLANDNHMAYDHTVPTRTADAAATDAAANAAAAVWSGE